MQGHAHYVYVYTDTEVYNIYYNVKHNFLAGMVIAVPILAIFFMVVLYGYRRR